MNEALKKKYTHIVDMLRAAGALPQKEAYYPELSGPQNLHEVMRALKMVAGGYIRRLVNVFVPKT